MINRPLTRRTLLQRGAVGATILTLPGLLAACGGDSGGGSSDEVNDVLNFANWPLYIDVDEDTKQRPTLDKFTSETGIAVNYFEEINDNATYFAKVQGPLSQGTGIDRDIFVFTDNSRFPSLLIENGWVEKLNKDLIPNIENLIPAQQSPPFDPNREYSLPWQSGMTGIAWNPKVTKGDVTSIEQLLTDPALKGKVTMLTEMADSIGLVMQQNGDDPTQITDDTFDAAVGMIQKAVDSGQIRRFTGNDYAEQLTSGSIAAAVAWSGDIVQLQIDNPDLQFVIPDAGGMIWTDNMLVPLGGSAATASTFMNFVYDPVNQAPIEAYVNYIPPVEGTKEELAKIDPELANNPLIIPDAATLDNVSGFDSTALNNEDYIKLWQQVLGA
jgi:spermidine/putrescine transport system substrate-binding protein